MEQTWRRGIASVGAAAFLSLAATGADAASYTIGFSNLVSGTMPVAVDAANPVLTATFSDVDLDTVSVTFSAMNLKGVDPNQFISNIYFNFSGNAGTLSAAWTGGTGPSSGWAFQTDANALPNTGGGLVNTGSYDNLLAFTTSNKRGGLLRFNGGETVTFAISSTVAINAGMFNVVSTGGALGAFAAMAHVQGIGTASGWIGANPYQPPKDGGNPPSDVPGPVAGAGLPALAGLLGAFALVRRRRQRV